jgi:hypothetical protein
MDEHGSVTTPAEALSWTAYNDHGVRQSSIKAPFAYFWPLPPPTAGEGSELAARRAQAEAQCLGEMYLGLKG